MAGVIPGNRLPELVALICSWAADRDEVLTPIRLVKFLYLADLYHARKTGGETLTGWPWRFVHFGPYCAESLQAVDAAVSKGLVARSAYESKFTGEEKYVYRGRRSQGEPPIERLIDLYTTGTLKRAVRNWADDTAGLLTHVYFETEPMSDIEPYDFLDFRKARRPPNVERVPAVKLSADKKKKALEVLAALHARTSPDKRVTPLDIGVHDEVFQASVANEDVSDGAPSFSGIVRFGDLRQPNEES